VWRFKTATERQEWPQLRLGAQALVWGAGVIYWLTTGRVMVVTSVISGPHLKTGNHPKGRAFDVRANDLTAAQKEAFFGAASDMLGVFGARVLWEDKGAQNEHFHIDY